MKRKSQAALEFLTTYAWAFLVILIMVGALAYFGILRPNKLLPDRCNFGAEVGCLDYSISSGGGLNLRLKNNIGEAIKVVSVSIDTESGSYGCTDATTLTGDWSSDVIKEPTWTGCDATNAGFVAGDKAKVLVTINYYALKSGSTYGHEVAGEIFATVT